IARLHVAGVEDRAEAGHDAAPDEAGSRGRSRPVDLHTLRRRDQRVIGERADAESGAERLAPQGHLLPRVRGVEAVPRSTPEARSAPTARRPPRDDDEVTDPDVRDAISDLVDHARGLVP